MKKQVFFLLGALIAIWQSAYAYDFSYTYQGKTLYYNIVNGEAQVTRQNTSSPYYSTYPTGDLTIPSSVTRYDGTTYAVTSIGDRTFFGCSGLTSVTIPNSITSIGDEAFSGCSGLTSANIGSSVTSIGQYAFSSCSSLTSANIPNSITWIGSFAFRNCSSLTSITIPNSVTRINSSTFYNCISLTSVTIPSSVTSISERAFYGCSSLTSVTIPNSITSIGDYAFYNCRLDSLTIGYGLTNIGTNVFKYDSVSYLSYNCPISVPSHITKTRLTTVVIGDSVTSIGYESFRSCSCLTSVSIGDGVNSIGNYAFQNCIGLTSISIPEGVNSIGYDAFENCSGLTFITIPNSITSIGQSAFSGCSALTFVTIGNSVTSIGGLAFKNCSGLTSVVFNARNCTSANSSSGYSSRAFFGCNNITNFTFGDSVDVIPDYLCYGLSGLTSVIIPNNVTLIGDYAFYGCSSLTSIIISNSITAIGTSVFSECSGLTSVTIPNSVTSIGSSSFAGCSGLTSVTIPNSVTSIGSSAFSGCSGLTSVVFNAQNCTNAGSSSNCAFSGCNNITSFTFGDSVRVIPSSLCRGLSGLTSITIPNSITSIGYRSFAYCSGLTSVIFNAQNCTSADSSSFSGCDNITSFTFGDSVGVIPSQLCFGLNGLTSINIPNSVNSIGYQAFSYCSGLTSVIFNARNCTSASSSFYGCNNITSFTFGDSVGVIPSQLCFGLNGLTSINIPNSVNSIGIYAFSGCSNLDTVFLMPENAPSLGSNAFNNNASGRVFILSGCTYDNYYNNSTWSSYSNDLRDPIIEIDINVLSSDTEHGGVSVVQQRGHNVRCDSTAVIEATANYGYHFDHWINGSTANPDTIMLTGDTTITAIFAINQYSVIGYANNDLMGIVSGSDTVDYLDSVALTATANYGYHFSHWSDNITDNPRTVVSTENINLIAIFDYNQYTINVNVDTTIHGACTGGGNYNYLSTRIIQANVNYGYHFTQWNDSITDNPRTIVLTQDTSFTAYYAPNQYSVIGLVDSIEMGIVTGSNTVYYMDTVVLTATANYGYHFSHWSDNITDNPRTVVATENINLIAILDYNQYTINVNVDTTIHGAGTGSGNYNYLSNRAIQANANYGYHFVSWSDGDTSNPRTILLTQDTAFTAYFASNLYSVTGLTNDSIKGIVEGSSIIEYLDSVTLIAMPNYGYHFSHWSDNNTDNPRTVMATSDINLTAVFDFNQYTITLSADTTIHGTVSGAGEYNYLSEHNISATANYGYHFTHWNDGITDNPRTITLTQDTQFVAIFERNTYTLTANVNDVTLGSVSFPSGDTALYLDTLMVVATPVAHYHVAGWSGQGIIVTSANKDTVWVEMSDNRLVTCIFAIDTHIVNVVVNDISRGMVEATGTVFVYGTPCTVTATAYSGYTFMGWSNGATYNPYTFAVLEDVELTAIFLAPDEIAYTITVESDDPTMGTATVNGSSTVTVMSGDSVTITATAFEGYRFVRWNDNDTHAVRTVTVTADATYTAYFESTTQRITDVNEGEVRVYAVDGRIHVIYANEPSALPEIRVYDLMGREVFHATHANETSALPGGIYLVKVGTLPARKVVVIR